MNEKIKNIVFDFGGVLYNIDIPTAIKGFHELGILIDKSDSLFGTTLENLESGKMSDDEFFDVVANMTQPPSDKKAILKIFYSVLTGLDMESFDYLLKFKKNYTIFLLSNTSELHYNRFKKEINENNKTKSFFKSFKKEYYSFLMKMRKPNIEIFQYVVNDSGINPAETVFIDDNPDNVESAKKLGINGFVFGSEGRWQEFIQKFDLKI
jgi:glucose-1-phosphatase